jgi:hypothetical protein
LVISPEDAAVTVSSDDAVLPYPRASAHLVREMVFALFLLALNTTEERENTELLAMGLVENPFADARAAARIESDNFIVTVDSSSKEMKDYE